MQRGTNLGRLGDFNQAVIFESIRRAAGGVSRVELAESTGLSPQTISNVVRRLLDEGLVREDRTVVLGPGKPRTVLELEADRLLSLGVHVDPGMVSVVMLDLRGEVVVSKRVDEPSLEDPERALEAMASAVEELIEASGRPRGRILGVGVVAPGPMDRERGFLAAPPLLDGWNYVEIVEPLRRRLDMDVLLEKDTIAAALAELWKGPERGRENFVFMYLGAGIGAGIVVNGEVLRGVSNNAGEVGHFSVGMDFVEEGAEPCRECGRLDCLAVAFSFARVAASARRRGIDLPEELEATVAGRAAGMNRLVELALGGNGEASALVRGGARMVAQVASRLSNALDVDEVIFGGPLWAALDGRHLATVAEVINGGFVARDLHGISVVSSDLGHQVGAIGGACAVMDALLSPKASALLLR
ncbi:transcriptional regulator [Zafaria cholistanensis]|uniref:Transcriptional regulator n=1 Tax=Zafaria cholistanensis TaxID=1682741 RepID=A0A5A7NT21_9MICC|nr:ROK family transcriptional regulator [Zafaria cholistanensis]GER23923.1 transcriptional regulator [Zafaria cholistanensis]